MLLERDILVSLILLCVYPGILILIISYRRSIEVRLGVHAHVHREAEFRASI